MAIPETLSPLTMTAVPSENSHGHSPWVAVFHHRQHGDGFADFYLAGNLPGRLIRTNHYVSHLREYTMAETQETLSLVRSYLWRVLHMDRKPLIVTTADGLDTMLTHWDESSELRYFSVKTFEELSQEAESLTFEVKALETLVNIKALWLPSVNIIVPDRYQLAQLLEADTIVELKARASGLYYASRDREAEFVFEHLLNEGYIRHWKDEADCRYVIPTAKGLLAIDKLARGKSIKRQGFLVRRFDPNLDEFLRPVMLEVSDQLRCPIQAVWEQDHNDRLTSEYLG